MALALEPRFEGWEGIVHGGILSTILDEVMAWSLVGEDNWGVTARMAVEFRRAGPRRHTDPRRGLDHPRRDGASSTRPDGSSTPTTGEELATATGVYVAASPDRKRDLQARYAFRG